MVFLDSGNGKNHKAIKLCKDIMTDDFNQALLGFQAFTGNDYVSLFFTKRKAASWKKMVKNGRFIKRFQEFSLSWEIPQESSEVIGESLCSIYGFSCSSINKVRGKVFSKRFSQQRRPTDLSLLPPVNMY